jgi:flavin reductase (DIM6/NTAB) family NADH-FMN oxidoreductase RutF
MWTWVKSRAFDFVMIKWATSTSVNKMQGALRNVAQPLIKDGLRHLLRETAQPVAVVVAGTRPNEFHGATLSSFTSVAFDPVPLVAFSLRIPSRMATSLKASTHKTQSRLVINLLSARQAETAIMFSRPDLHPRPFESVGFFRNRDGIPVQHGSLGALSCQLVTSLPLAAKNLANLDDQAVESARPSAGSELFIAEVMGVEASDTFEESPLVYYQRGYTTCVSPKLG